MAESAPTKVIPVTSDDQFSSTVASFPADSLQVLYFHAPWAAPCAQMSTVLETLASTYPQSNPLKIGFLSIDAEELPDIAEDHDVTAVPFVVLKRDGQVLDTISGSDASRVRASVEKHYPSTSNGANGNARLPPAQKVTRPATQPLPEGIPSSVTNSADPSQLKASASTAGGPAKNMSAYAPSANDDGPTQNSAPDTNEPKDLQARLTQLTNAAPVMLFMKGTPSAPQCGFSRQLVSMLRQNSVRYGFFNILADDDVRQGLKEFADWPTYPQLWMGGDLVGGLDIVREELDNDPDFFSEYVVDNSKGKQNGTLGATTAPEAQATAS